ncbi:MAG: MFS transporter, partial [Solirubrobacteraceae bacterium]
ELAGAALLLGAFLMIERRSRQPMLPLSLFRAPAFAGAQLSALAISASFFALYLYATLYLQDVLGLSAIDAGLAYLPGTLTIFVVSGASASLGERIAPGAMIAGGLVLVAAGLALMMLAGAHSSWLAVQPGLMLAAIGCGLFNPALSTVALTSAPPTMSGLAAGVNDTARQAGVAIGIAGLGTLIPAHAIALHSVAYVHGMRHALLAGAGLAAAGAIAAWRLVRSDAPAEVSVEPALAEAS